MNTYEAEMYRFENDEDISMEEVVSFGLPDLNQIFTPEELDYILGESQNDLYVYQTPISPIPSSPDSPVLSETGSAYSSPSQSPVEWNIFNFDSFSCSPKTECISYPNSPMSSSMGSPMIYTQNNLQQVPKSQESTTKTSKKRIPQSMKACKHIWQFLRDLLQNPEYRTWITWLDQKRGIFKILKPDETASLWRVYKSQDRRKDSTEDYLDAMDEKNSKQKYPNMARGIRYSRDCGYFETISKEEMRDYGKKLVYKFSKSTTIHCSWLRSLMADC